MNDQLIATLSPRMARFRDASRQRGAAVTSSPRRRNQAKAFFGLYPDAPYWERYARSLAFALENEPVYVFADESLVGMLYQTPSNWEMPDEEDARRWERYDAWKQMGERQREIGRASCRERV